MSDNNKSEQIRIYGKDITFNVKNFDSLDEFNQYYNLHKSEIDELSTNCLNKIYHIKDYKITRRKLNNNEEVPAGQPLAAHKQLCFQLMKPNLPKETNESTTTINALQKQIEELKFEVSKIKQQVIEIVKVFNGSN